MLDKIREIIIEQLNLQGVEITEDTSFKDDLGADSLDLFELVMAFEEEFSVEIPEVSIQLTPFLNLVALQLIAFETACLLNDNVDQPRDLQKCVANE